MTTPIGTLRHRITLQSRQRSPADGGGAAITYEPVITLSASIAAATGYEIVAADGRTGRVTHDITLRFNRSVQPGMHFVEGARTFIIHAALDPDGRRRWLRCQCEERLP